ncbi:phage protease [Vulcaniibacterium tengchongense]|nr:phage protease [Vulcaniibacterium tengchongense]
MPHRIAVNSELQPADGGAPEWVELIPAGPIIAGRDGRSWVFEAGDAQAVIAAFRSRSADLPIDWEHATQHRAPNGLPAPAAGWITDLDFRGGALWGRVSWTPRGRDQVANREYRYISPVFDYVPDTGRIVRLVSAGLANLANLHLQALNQEDSTMSRSTLLTAAIVGLGLTEQATDDQVATAINQLKQDRDGALERATNAEKKQPSLDRYVPRADYDALVQRATNAENALKARDKAEHERAVDEAITAALKAGKITPATESYHRAACSDTEGLKRFKEFVAAAPSIGEPSNLGERKPEGAATALNAEQKEACRLLGISEAEYLKELQRAA